MKVYNRFDELILHLRWVPENSIPLQIVDGTRHMQEAVQSLIGHEFDETVVIEGQSLRFRAAWGTPEYLETLAGYWGSNFKWRTQISKQSMRR